MKRHHFSVDRHTHNPVKHSQLGRWQRFFSRATTRVLAWYFMLTACSGVVAILMTRQLLYHHIEQQAEQHVLRKVEVFRGITQNVMAQAPSKDNLAVVLDTYFQRYRYIPRSIALSDSAVALIGHN